MADETQKTLIDITALKYFYKSLQNVTVLIAPSSIEAASASNLGRTYFIPVDGTYAGVKCSKGDHIVSNGVAWILIPKGTSEGGKEYFAGTGIDISTVDGKDVISNTGVRKIAKADENHPGTIKTTTGNNNPEYIEVAGLDTAAFMPYETELTEDSDDAIPTSKAVADYVADEIADLSVADSEVEGQYVASVAQEDGKITIIRQSLPTSLPASDVTDEYSATGKVPVSGKAVASAISGKENSNNKIIAWSDTPSDAKYPSEKLVKTEIDNLKNSVSDGKSSIASAITNNGVTTASDATFATMATNIGTVATNKYNEGDVAGQATAKLEYEPKSAEVDKAGNVTVKNADGTAKLETTTTNSYNAGVTATKVGTATAANVLSGKTFTNGSTVGATGTMKNNGAIQASVGYDGTYTIPAGYHNGSGVVTSNVTSGSLNNAATAGVTYTENSATATIIPDKGALYINAGYFPNTKITLGHMIPDDDDYPNAGNGEIRAGYEAYDTDGNKLVGTIANVTPKFTGGTASLTGTSNTITPSSNIATATSGDYYIDATAKAKATRTKVTYNGVATGYINVASGTSASAANTSAEESISADRVYLAASNVPNPTMTVANDGTVTATSTHTAGYNPGGTATNTKSAKPTSASVDRAGNVNVYLNSQTTTPVYTTTTANSYNAGDAAGQATAKTAYEPKSATVTQAGAISVKNAAGTEVLSTTTTNSYNAGVSATKVGTATAANVLSGKTFTNSSSVGASGTMTNNTHSGTPNVKYGSETTATHWSDKTLNCGGQYEIPAGYHDGKGVVSANSLSSQTGVDSGKTAVTAGTMLTGYQGWVNGSKITGTMASNGAVSQSIGYGESYTVPAGYHNGSGKVTNSVGAGTITSGSATISSASYAYDSTNKNFKVTGSATISAPSVGTAGYVSSSVGTKNTNTASLSTTVATVGVKATNSGTTTVTPVISKVAKPSGDTWTDGAGGNATTTKPTSGVYIEVQSAKNTGTLTSTPAVSSAGYGTTSYYTATNGTSTVGANASAATYVPVKTGTATTPTASGASTSTTLSGTTLTVARSVTPTVSAGWVASGTAGTVTITGTVPTETKTANTSTSDQTISPSTGKLLSSVTVKAVTTANISAENIKKGVTVTVGDTNSATRIKNVTGTLDYIKTVTSVPSTQDTSIIYNSTTKKYYLWR